MRRSIWLGALVVLTLASGVCGADATYDVGVAGVDITPDYPIRLSGFGFRRVESEGVTQRIAARALAISRGTEPPLVAITVDNLGVPSAVWKEVLRRINERTAVPAERFAICSSHTHTAPMLRGVCVTLYGMPIAPDEQERINKYTDELTSKLTDVARQAIAARRPARLFHGIGQVPFAMNRRQGGGPVDHDLPLLAIRNMDGTWRAVWVTYACHCVTLSNNRVSGDWAGYAREGLERALPGAQALVSIGCGADQNPNSGVTGDKVNVAAAQGEQIVAETQRLLKGFLAPVEGELSATRESLELPLAELPPRARWEELGKRPDAIGYHARVNLARLDRGEPLTTKIDYSVTTWSFGESLAQVFLPGEVVVDYAIRIKKELDGHRVWVHGYSNDAPCYIPSERILREGGYEGGGAMVYYDVPGPFRPGLEQPIIDAVKRPLAARFAPRHDPNRTQGSRPRSAQQSWATLRLKPGFQADLVAAEPLTVDPVAIDFDAEGRLWVAEMHDYPLGLDGKFSPGGRVRVLVDRDRDGVFDESTVFLDKIPFPTGLFVWRKGVLVCAAPDVIYAEDTNGDGRADEIRKVLSGFGVENYQGRVNSLAWGLDGWLYGSCGLFGGQIKATGGDEPVALGNRDFRFHPDEGDLEPATGRTQQSRVRDDWGNWFGCDNSNLARHYVLEDHDLRRNTHIAPPAVTVNLAAGTEGNRVFSLLPSAQRFKLSGPVNQVTAACGLGVYRDSLLGADYTGNLFTCEPVNLVVHRRVLVPDGGTFRGERAADERESEFLASTDSWFRPVQARTGPDGALWVVDMSRYVIEHPRWIPAEDLAQVDVRAGHSQGRIYRIRPSDVEPRPIERLDRSNALALIDALESPNGPQRDLASQLLVEYPAPDADSPVVRRLETLVRSNPLAVTRLHALVALDQWGRLSTDTLLAALADSHPGVVRHGVRIAGERADDEPTVAQRLLALAPAKDARVRLEVACALGEISDRSVGRVLADMVLAHPQDSYLQGAALSSLDGERAADALAEVFAKAKTQAPPESFVSRLVATMSATANEAGLVAVLRGIDSQNAMGMPTWQWAAAAGFFETLQRRGIAIASILPNEDQQRVERLFQAARDIVAQADLPDDKRVAAIRLLGRRVDDRAAEFEVLKNLLGPRVSPAVRSAAISTFARINDERVPALLLADWQTLTPATHAQVLDVLLSRPAWQKVLVDRLESKTIPVSQIDAARRQQLATQLSGELKRRAENILAGSISADRQQVIAHYRTTLDQARGADSAADAKLGQVVFAKRCAACHRLGAVGHDVGPNLATVANKTAEFLLTEILDPNRNVDSRYLQYVAVGADGRTHTGLLASESATSVTLKGQEARSVELLRSDLDEFRGTGKSIMPEGFERDVNVDEMRQLLAYLRETAAAIPAKKFPGNSPATVTLGTNGSYALRAALAELRGPELAFEPAPFRNIGYWHSPQDEATWNVDVAKEGRFDVYLDYSCHDDSAGNAYAIDGLGDSVRGRIATTGGWDKYRQVKVATVSLSAGKKTVAMRPDSAALKGALADLRAIVLVPAGQALPPSVIDSPQAVAASAPSSPPKTPAEIARRLLDDSVPQADRQRLLDANLPIAGPIVAQMVADLEVGTPEEYRRIPWIWRVAIAAGKQNDAATLRSLLEVSIPARDAPLRDWQAVVLGGGVINGLSQRGVWPGPRMKELIGANEALAARWGATIRAAHAMCDNEQVPTGTRYDALRIIPIDAWKTSRERLERYLARGVHPELQMGAVSGLVDVDQPEVAGLLVKATPYLNETNRNLAIAGLLRNDARTETLLAALQRQEAKVEWLSEAQRAALRTSKNAAIKALAEQLRL